MSAMPGRFIVERELFDDPFFRAEAFTEREAWSWLVGVAAFEARQVRFERAEFAVARGELVVSLRFLCVRWRWPIGRVQRFLRRLKADSRIDTRASREATVLRVRNYDQIRPARFAGDASSDAPIDTKRNIVLEEHSPTQAGQDARARAEFAISESAKSFAAELAAIGRHDPERLGPAWLAAGPAMRVQRMIDAGWRVEFMRELAVAAMRVKRDGPPRSIRYFEKIFARAHEARAQPTLPLPPVGVATTGGFDAADRPRSASAAGGAGDWRSRRDARHDARAALKRFVAEQDGGAAADRGGGGGEPAVRLVPHAGHGRP